MNYHFLFFTLLAWLSMRSATGQTFQLSLEDKRSYLEIQGSTNINSFHCLTNTFAQKDIEVTCKKQLNSLLIQHETFEIPIEEFNCDVMKMTSDFKNLLEYETYPIIEVELIEIINYQEDEADIIIEFTIKGIKQKYRMSPTYQITEDFIIVTGEKNVDMKDFAIQAPVKFFGTIRVKEEINIHFNLCFQISQEK